MDISISSVVMICVLGLLALGLYSLLIVRNLIRLVVALQVLMKGVLVAIILAGRVNGQLQVSQSMALTVIVADTIVAVVALALAVQVQRCQGTLDIKALTSLRR